MRTARYAVLVTFGAMALVAGVVSATAQPKDCSGRFWAEYYNDQNKRVFTRCEGQRVRANWGQSGPRRGGGDEGKADSVGSLIVGTDHFRVTWTGSFPFQAGVYTFVAKADDGIRVSVDGTPVIDMRHAASENELRATRTMTAGQHVVKVEYVEDVGMASVDVRWMR
ncbi:MAG: PA14 domain-containing protein [Vicinamibacterales bacterium]